MKTQNIMNKLFIILLINIYSCSSQITTKKEYIYIYINTNIKYDISINEKSLNPIETNLYRIGITSLDNITIRIADCKKKLNKKYFTNHKFINLSIKSINNDYKVLNNSKKCNFVIITRFGDLSKYHNQCTNNNCIKITFEYPEIIIINNELNTTVNSIFSKYIFD